MVYGVLHKLRHPRHSLRADSLTHISRPYIPSLLIGSLPTPIWTRPFMSPLSWAPRIYSLSLTCACVCVCVFVQLLPFPRFHSAPFIIPPLYVHFFSLSLLLLFHLFCTCSCLFYFYLSRRHTATVQTAGLSPLLYSLVLDRHTQYVYSRLHAKPKEEGKEAFVN